MTWYNNHQRDGLIWMTKRLVHSKWDSQHILDARAREALPNHLRQLGGVLQGPHVKGNSEVPQRRAGIAVH
jgi:hypothetical protein